MMKLKHITLGIGCLLVMAGLHSCIDDRGSSASLSEDEVMPVKIEKFKDTTVVIQSTLKITPKITGLEEGREYSYLWYAANSVTAGMAPARDTLSQASELVFPVTYEAGTYNLVFEVRDVKRNIYAREQLLMTVASDFAYGWYVLKDEADKTDFDFVLSDGTVKPNVIRSMGMQPLEGKAKAIAYQSGRYYHEITNPDGTVATLVNKKAMYVLSEKGMRVLNADNMSLFKDFNESFYEAPATKKPQNIRVNGIGGDAFLINAGKLHTIYGMSANIGKFAYAKVGDYELHEDMMLARDLTVWDKKSKTFFTASSSGVTLNNFSEQTDVTAPMQISPTNMPVELVSLLTHVSGYSGTIYAVMSHPDKREYYVADMITSGYPFVSFDTLPANCNMPEADVMAAHGIASCIYFAKGSELSVYRLIESADREAVIKTFPGETIEFIENIRSTNVKDKFNHLVVLTNSANGWKIYRFEIIGETPDINPEPIKVYSGQGTGRRVIFRI